MKFLIAAATVAAVACAALPAAAQGLQGTTFYGNLGYNFVNTDNVDVDLSAISGKLGARFNPYLGVEAEAAFGVSDDTVHVGAVPVKVELEHSIAAYVVGYYPVSPTVDLFARLGYGNAKIKATASVASVSASTSADDSAWNAGLGAQWFFTANDGVRGEYTKYGIDDNGLQADAYTVSYVRKF